MRDHSIYHCSLERGGLRPSTGKVQTCHEYWNLNVTVLWLDHICAGTVKFPKSWLLTLPCRQKINHFFFSQIWGSCLKHLPSGSPYMLIFSFTYNAVVPSQFRCVHPKIRQKFLILTFYESKTNVAYRSGCYNNVVHCKYSLLPASN